MGHKKRFFFCVRPKAMTRKKKAVDKDKRCDRMHQKGDKTKTIGVKQDKKAKKGTN